MPPRCARVGVLKLAGDGEQFVDGEVCWTDEAGEGHDAGHHIGVGDRPLAVAGHRWRGVIFIAVLVAKELFAAVAPPEVVPRSVTACYVLAERRERRPPTAATGRQEAARRLVNVRVVNKGDGVGCGGNGNSARFAPNSASPRCVHKTRFDAKNPS